MAFEPIGSLIEPRGPEAPNAHKVNSGRWGAKFQPVFGWNRVRVCLSDRRCI